MEKDITKERRAKGQLLLGEASDYLHRHMESRKEMYEKTCYAIPEIALLVTNLNPLVLLNIDSLLTSLGAALELGFYLGRTYQDVPECIKKEVK